MLRSCFSVRLVAPCALALFAVACSSGGSPSEEGRVGAQAQAITDGCTLAQFGAPCDAGGGECSGICTLAEGSGGVFATCSPTTGATENDGKVCGKTAGQAGDCTHTCHGGACLPVNAASGTPCKPHDGGTSTLCDGVCTAPSGTIGPPTCVERATKCPPDVSGDCHYSFCDATSGTCTSYVLPSGAPCLDGDVCTNNACDASGTCTVTSFAGATTPCATGLACTTGDHCSGTDGTCVAGPPVTCPPSTRVCFANECVEPTGCASVVTPGAGCTPSSKCFTAGNCSSSGACTPTTPLDCDDGDPCTTDGCADATGCTHATKCTADACHVAACDPTSGGCTVTEKNCNDGDPCTTDGCSVSAGGCTHTPISGCGADTGVPDTGASDTGTITDSGSSGDGASDSGSSVDGGSDSATSDTGAKKDGGSDTGGSLDGALLDAGADASDDGDIKLESGCGCRIVGAADDTDDRREGSSGAASIAFAAAALFVLRRRRASR